MSLTPIDIFDGWSAKREDRAFYVNPNLPSGSKVRQYLTMAGQKPGAPMLVGCTSTSAMQVYVAYASAALRVPGIVYVSRRNVPTASTEWSRAMGAEIHEIPNGRLPVVRKRAKDRGAELGAYVRWDAGYALRDVAYQCSNIPVGTRRVVLPVGSGLIFSGVLAGLALYHENPPEVLAVSVSGLFDMEKSKALASRLTERPLPKATALRHPTPYERGVAAALPDGTPLDPYYSAKSLASVGAGDCLWVPGVRPLGAFPQDCLSKLFAQLPRLKELYCARPPVPPAPGVRGGNSLPPFVDSLSWMK
jgi:hypothetical protein